MAAGCFVLEITDGPSWALKTFPVPDLPMWIQSLAHSPLSALLSVWVPPVCVGPSQVALVVKSLPANVGDVRNVGLIPGSGRSPGGGQGYPVQYSCLENPMDRGAWPATVHGVAELYTTEATFHACPLGCCCCWGYGHCRSSHPVQIKSEQMPVGKMSWNRDSDAVIDLL